MSGIEAPVIDLSDFDARKEEITSQLMEAAKTLGFFYVTGHGIRQDLMDAALSQADSLFHMPNEYKDALPRVDWGRAKVLGYERNNLTDGTVHESFLHQYDCHTDMKLAWPKDRDIPGYKKVTLEYMQSCHSLAARMLRCFAVGIGFPEEFFEEMIKVNTSENHTFLQYHKYPSTENLKYKPGTLRYTGHTDESIMTILVPSPGSVGLEVASGHLGTEEKASHNSKAAGATLEEGFFNVKKWTQFPQKDGCIIINIGDPLQMWSDGLLKSNFHRVRMPRGDEPKDARFSLGYFIWPLLDTKIEGRQGKYKPQTMREFMEVKGKMYAASFSQDTHELESVQDLVFGNPAKNVEVQAQA